MRVRRVRVPLMPRPRGSPVRAARASAAVLRAGGVERPVDQAGEPDGDAGAADGHQRHLDGGARLEPHRRPGGNGEPHAVGGRPVERQPRVDLEEVEVRRDADRHVGGVGDRQLHQPGRRRRTRAPAVMTAPGASSPSPAAPAPNGLRTTTMRVPSSKIASTFTSVDDVGHTGQHVVDGEHGGADGRGLHQPRPVAGRLADGVGDERRGLGHVQPQTPRPPGPGQFGGGEDEQPVAVGRREAHALHAIRRSRPATPGRRIGCRTPCVRFGP